MSTIEARLAELERKTRELADIIAIYQLFATYGPAVDSMSSATIVDMWAAEGTFEPEHHIFRGATEVGAMIDSEMHHAYVDAGCAHVMSLPRIVIEGDVAKATGYSRLYLRDGDHWRVERASANHWTLVRAGTGWKVERRINRMLSGSEEARGLLATDLAGG